LRFLIVGSWKLTITAVANPPDQTRETEYSEGRHAGRNREKDAARSIAEASDQEATSDGYRGADKRPRDRPLHSARALTGAVQSIPHTKEAEDGADRPQVG
jgi:hypothetical protein